MKLLTFLFAGLSSITYGQFWEVSEPVRLGGTVNTGAEESIPVFSMDSSMLYFVRTYDKENRGDNLDQDIWFSKKEADGSYSDCELAKAMNNKMNNAVLGISRDGNSMYLLNSYDGKKDEEKGISVTRKKGESWGEPEKLMVPGLNIDGDFYGFHVSEDESVMIISYAGPGTLGQEDLYVSINNNGSWSAPMHMGNTVNSTGYEISPFLSKSNDTLFFSSNGMGGQGDADIFYSVKKGGWNEWSTPKNLGNKINSPKFDAYFIHNGKQAYWSSNRDGELSDIYIVEILTPPALAISCKGMDVTVHKGTDGKINSTPDGGVGPYTFKWSNGSTDEDPANLIKGEYSVIVTDALGQTAECACTVGEPGPPAYADVAMKHYYDYNANKLIVTDGELKNFVNAVEDQVAKGRKNITIEIYSSASYVPTKTFKTNEKLAKSRAEEIQKVLKSYFKEKGIDGDLNIVIIAAIVDGPAYENDSVNQDKYRNYQFIELKTK